jgi:hypothetical protein
MRETLQKAWHFLVLQHPDFVGRAPWPAADPLVGLLDRKYRPRFWLRVGCFVGQLVKLRPIGNRPSSPSTFLPPEVIALVSEPPHHQKSEMFYFSIPRRYNCHQQSITV